MKLSVCREIYNPFLTFKISHVKWAIIAPVLQMKAREEETVNC